jgi:hypothetical protein
MVTKDGQDRLIANLQKLVDKATGETAKKVTELAEFVKQGSVSQALVPTSGPLTRTLDPNSSLPLHKVADGAKPYSSPKAADFVSDEMLKFLRKIKDSVTEAGGVTMGTKAMIQDLRGEVLGMGRELARKIEEVERTKDEPRSIESGESRQDVALIVQEGLAQVKRHMDEVMRERRRQSISSTITRNTVDNQEVYDVVKHALAERGLDGQSSAVDTEAIISVIREAWESYKPDITVDGQFGLEREEILQCLHEGLQEYRGSSGVTKEEVERIIQDAIQHVKLPPPINEAHEIREEVLMAVRECLQEFNPSVATRHAEFDGLSREVILEAIKEGLRNQQPSGPLEVEISQDVLFDAVRAGLEASRPQAEHQSNEVILHLQAMVDDMHSEFKNYSSANGRDTEQVLDALKDGLDSLRAEIETYVDKAQDVTQRDEIVDNIRHELERLRVDVQGYVAEGPRGDQAWSRGDMVAYIKSEFEHLHESIAPSLSPSSNDKVEIINALNAGFEGMKSQVVTRGIDLETNEEINEAMKQEFDQLKDVILGDTASQKDEVLEMLQTGFTELHAKLGHSGANSESNDTMLASIKEEFEHLRNALGGTLMKSGGATDKDDIIDAVRELITGLQDSIGSTMVRSGDSTNNGEVLEALRSGLEEIKANSNSPGINEELLEALRGELEQVRSSNGLTRQHGRADTEEVLEAVRLGLDDLRSHMEKKLDNPDRQMSATNDIIDALNDGLEGLRTDVTKIVDKPVDMTVSYEILDTLKDGIASLREEIGHLKGRKTDSTMDDDATPTGNEVVLADDPEANTSRETSRDIVEESLRRNDLEKMEVMLAQLQIKVEAMDANIQNPPAPESTTAPGSAMKEDLSSIEYMLKELQVSVLELQARGPTSATVEGMATKEDTDAIETLLGNIKAKIAELNLPDLDKLVTKENLDDVELVVRTASENIDALSKKIAEEGATKGDVAVVQVLVDDVKQALEEMKSTKRDEEEDSQKVTKTDVDDLALLVAEIKAKVDDMRLPDPDELPSKADLEQLTGLLHDFRESHDKMRDSYEDDIKVTAKAFDDRKNEAEATATGLSEVKVVLDEIKEEIKTNLTEGGALDSLQESFKTLEEGAAANSLITADVKELMETVSREFERAHGSIEGLLNGQEEKSALALEKHDEAKEAIITGLVEKVDDRFNTLMAKYDDAQLLADEQAKVMKEKAEEQEKILESTKTMADELRLTIDTLGATIAGMNDRFEEATQKWSADSATVFDKLGDTMTKLEEQKLDDKTEHSHTRDEIANVERIFNGLQDNITEYHPKFMVTLREIEALVKQQYEHSQKAKETADEQVRALTEEAKTRSEELSKHFSNLPALLPAPPSGEAADIYDDTQVQEKLDKLIGQATDAEKSTAQLERLDEIHKQVMATAAEVTEFVAKQTQLITDGSESKEREAEELGLVVERKLAQKEHLEADIEDLKAEKERVMQELKEEKERVLAELKEEKDRTMHEVKEEKDSLLAVVAALQAERENLANQKVRLTGEVSSLHTALDIRREELHMMDAKADALERRILNGIMDHSRALMIAKGTGAPKSPSKLKKRQSVDVSNDSKLMPPPSAAASALNMALKSRPAVRRNGPPQNPANRRILSLSQISGNTPTGAQAYPSTANSMSNAGGNLKRSHSVKTSNYLRKSSWNGRPSDALDKKENEILSEEDELETETVPASVQLDDRSVAEVTNIDDEDHHSEAGTERRHSITSGSYAESYGEGETPGYDGRSSFGGTGSEYTYASGSSYMTGSDVDRRTSYGSTAARSTLLGGENTIDEHSEGEDEESQHTHTDIEDGNEDEESTVTVPPLTRSEVAPSEVAPSEITASEVSTQLPTQSEVDRAVEAVKEDLIEEGMKDGLRIYTAPSDSGLGTDIPTAALGNDSEADYFRRQAEEESTVG